MKKYSFIFITILLVFLITSCSKSNVPPPTPLDKIPPQNVIVKVLWHKKVGNGNTKLGNYNVAPACKDDKVFVPNQNGRVYALNIVNGKVLWKRNMLTNLSSPAETIANAVILGSIKGDIMALDTNNGATLWHSYASSSIFTQPTVYDNDIYTHTHDGSVAAFDAKNGKKLWSVTNNIPEITLPGNSSPIILNNTVMIGSEFGTVLGFTVDEGDRTINIPIAIAKGSSPADKMVDISANPLLYGDYLIFATYQGAIVALNKDNGKMLWAKKSSVVNNIIINNHIIFTVQDDSLLKAFDVKTGDTVWTNDTLKWRKITAPIYYKGLIVVADYEGYLHFFNSLNGNYLGRYKLTPQSKIFDNGISAELIPTEKGIIVQSENGRVYLVDAYSNKVIYDNILSDYKVDKGSEINHISPTEKYKDRAIKAKSKAEATATKPKVANKGLNVTLIIDEFNKQPKSETT